MALPLHLACPVALLDELTTGQNALSALFDEASPQLLRAGQPLASVGRADDVLYRLKAGWAYRLRQLSNGNRVIVDVYLPGDIISFGAAFLGAPIENVRTLTTTTVEVISKKSGLAALMAPSPIGLYILWSLEERQRRLDFLRASTAALDARGRLAAMVLDFYCRLETQGLIINSSFGLPLTQNHIGSYLGLTVVHVNRVIRVLREDGLVNIEKHYVTLFNIKALTTLAKMDSAMLARIELARSQATAPAACPPEQIW